MNYFTVLSLFAISTSFATSVPLTFSSDSWTSALTVTASGTKEGNTATLCLPEVSQVARNDRQPYLGAIITSGSTTLPTSFRPEASVSFPIVIQTGNSVGVQLTRDGSITISPEGVVTIFDGARNGFSRDGVRTGTFDSPCVTYTLLRKGRLSYPVTYTSYSWQDRSPLNSTLFVERPSPTVATSCIDNNVYRVDQAGNWASTVVSNTLINVPTGLFPNHGASFPIIGLSDNGVQQQLYRPGNLIFNTLVKNLQIADYYSQLYNPSGKTKIGSYRSTCGTYLVGSPSNAFVVFTSSSWVNDVTVPIQYTAANGRATICLPSVTATSTNISGQTGPARSATLPKALQASKSATFFEFVYNGGAQNSGVYGAIQYDWRSNQLVISRIDPTGGLVGFRRDGSIQGLVTRTCISYNLA